MIATTAELAFLPLHPGPSGVRFGVHHVPAGPAQGLVVFVHAFAEEMNKSRRMSALQSDALCAAGWAVLRIDLAGCGDSPGDFAEASWDQWIADVVAAAAWLRQRHARAPGASGAQAPLWLWGHRSGCLVASAAVHQGLECQGLLLWQAPASGQQVLRPFLRLRAAAHLAGTAGAKGDDVHQELAQAGVAEIGGYRLTRALAEGLGAATLRSPPSGTPVHWLEVSSAEQPALLPASLSTVQAWREAGVVVNATAVRGPAFWQTTEIECAPALVEASTRALAGAVAVGYSLPTSAGPGAPVPLPQDRVCEQAVTFDAAGQSLAAVITTPMSAPLRDIAVIVVVGGPQYRVGSHRQFTSLARTLASGGWPVLRFDVRGMGDSSGEFTGFESLSADIAAAIDAAMTRLPRVRRVVLWGLCDGASAALLYQHERRDARVRGLCLANPWVRTAQSLAQAQVKHYYIDRLRSRDFWARLARGAVGPSALKDLWRNLHTAATARRTDKAAGMPRADYRTRMGEAIQAFAGPVLVLLSGKDLTAREFEDHMAGDAHWRPALRGIRLERLADADHTFSRLADAARLHRVCVDWLESLGADAPASEGSAIPDEATFAA